MTSQWNPQPKDELDQRILEAADLALCTAVKKGASMSEVAIGQGQGMSVTVRHGEVETVEHNRDKSLGITVYFGHRCGSASTTDFSEKAIESSVQSACNIARQTEEDEYNGLAEMPLLATEFPDLKLCHDWNIGPGDAIDLAKQCETAALSSDDRITNTEGATVSSHTGVDLYGNTNGFRGFSHRSRHSISCSIIAGQGAAMQRDYWYDSRRDPSELASPEAIGIETSRRTVRRLGARKIKTGVSPVIFDPASAASLLSHLVTAISGASLYRKASFLLDKIDQAIFPSDIRIHEQPHLPKAAGSAVFDAEGVATSARNIVHRGILEGYVLNTYGARKLGLQTTANAGGVHNLTIDSTGGDFNEMLRTMGRGLVVTELIGFGVNTVTGDYSRGAFGFWVEDGAIQYPVQEFTIAGNLIDIFKGFERVGSDVDERQNLRTGSILVDSMTIAGQ